MSTKKYKIGDIRNGYPVLPQNKRKVGLLLSDDLRMNSGVGTMSKEIVLGTLHQYNWIQVAGAIKHPDKGKRIDMSSNVESVINVPDVSLLSYPVDGYGNPDLIRYIINEHNVDFILHYTDPRFWGWLYQMEHEIRQKIPIFYYAIWDDLPYPMWNAPYYASCDLIMGISKQSHNIHKTILKNHGVNVLDISEESTEKIVDDKTKELTTRIAHVPHGINTDYFYPITKSHPEWESMMKFKADTIGTDTTDFIVLYNSRNIRRKMVGDVILAYKTFCDQLPIEKAKRCQLILHTTPIDTNGTDLPALVDTLCPEYPVYFSHKKLDTKFLNYLYNISDVTINLASNEGWGLSTTESLMTATPIIVNVTGGLSDQCGFKKKDGSYITINDYTLEWSTNHDQKYTKYGKWVKPVFPKTRSLVGSVPTPYIFDDRADWEDAAIRLLEWYEMPTKDRLKCGRDGYKFITDPNQGTTASEMSRRFIKYQNETLENWIPRTRYKLFTVSDLPPRLPSYGISVKKEIKANSLNY